LKVRRYLLDTSVVSVLLRDPFGPVATRVTRHGIDRMCTSIIVAAELRFGGVKVRSPRLRRQIEAMLGSIAVLSSNRRPTSTMPSCARRWNVPARSSALTAC
jgi:predicted nucleic acid-binding protein